VSQVPDWTGRILVGGRHLGRQDSAVDWTERRQQLSDKRKKQNWPSRRRPRHWCWFQLDRHWRHWRPHLRLEPVLRSYEVCGWTAGPNRRGKSSPEVDDLVKLNSQEDLSCYVPPILLEPCLCDAGCRQRPHSRYQQLNNCSGLRRLCESQFFVGGVQG